MTESELLAHYVERGGEPWNVSLEAAWLDYELRAWFRPRLPKHWPARVCNIGIGVGLWDDWLGYELGVTITARRLEEVEATARRTSARVLGAGVPVALVMTKRPEGKGKGVWSRLAGLLVRDREGHS